MPVKIKPPNPNQGLQCKVTSENFLNDTDEPTQMRIEKLVEELIGRVADKWTMIILEILSENEKLRFTELSRKIGNISQKMLTQTLRQMERDGLISRKIYPVIPPKVEYSQTELGYTLAAAFCGVWVWAEQNLEKVDVARKAFAERSLSD